MPEPSEVGGHRQQPDEVSSTPTDVQRRTGRIPGVDLARAVAILGMLAVHVGPTDVEGPAGTLYALPHGRAAILFGLVAGLGVSLLATGRGASDTGTRLRLVWRAAVLLVLGLWLQELDHNVFVILQDYALLFVVATVLIAVPDRWLLVLSGASATLGSVIHLAGHVADPEAFARRPVVWDAPLTEIVHRLVLSGPYPLLTWLAPFALGMWLGRRDLRSPLLWWRLALVGGSVAVVARFLAVLLQGWWGTPPDAMTWDHLVADAPHSQMPLWVIGATGSAAFVLGVSLIIADRFRVATWPLVAVGQLAFTVYVGHLLALHAWRDALTSDLVGPATGLVLAFTAVAAAVATAWRAVLPRGPLELLLNPSWLASRTTGR